MKKIVLFFLISVFALFQGIAEEPDFDQLLKNLDELNTFETDLSCIYTIVSTKPGEEKSVMEIQVFRRDPEDQFLYLILKPDADKGQGFMKSGDNMWAYDPSSRKFSHFSMKENVGDSDSRNNDFEDTSLSEDYTIVDTEEGQVGKLKTWVLTLEAKHDEVATPKMKIWIRKDNNLHVKIEEYSLSNRLVRTQLIPKWIKIGNRFIPSKMLSVDNLKKGEKTQVTIKDPSLAAIPDDVFTKAYLERVNNR